MYEVRLLKKYFLDRDVIVSTIYYMFATLGNIPLEYIIKNIYVLIVMANTRKYMFVLDVVVKLLSMFAYPN